MLLPVKLVRRSVDNIVFRLWLWLLLEALLVAVECKCRKVVGLL